MALKLAMTDSAAAAAFEIGRARWPKVENLTFEKFRSFLDDAAVETAVLPERAADVFLAAAAAIGGEIAIRTFDVHLLGDLPKWLARFHFSEDAIQEVRQRLCSRLFVGPPPRIGQYRANGPLAAWVRMATIRVALDFCASAPLDWDGIGAEQPFPTELDPERLLIKRRYGPVFQRVLRDAMARLSKRDRNVLRFHYVSRMGVDAIARTYHVHRATITRWLAGIRDDLVSSVRVQLLQELGASSSDFRSLWNLVRSDLDQSLAGLLAARS
jgi:RNA polymerase sigma-70 factor, ECF subfamily